MDGIHEAIALGSRATANTRLMTVNLRLTDNRKTTLVGADGVVTEEGKEYYAVLGVAHPTIFPYEQPLHNGKWVLGFDLAPGVPGKWHQMRRPGAPGHWAVTKKGAEYFKHNQDEWLVQYPVRRMFREKVEGKTGLCVQPIDGEYLTVDNTHGLSLIHI